MFRNEGAYTDVNAQMQHGYLDTALLKGVECKIESQQWPCRRDGILQSPMSILATLPDCICGLCLWKRAQSLLSLLCYSLMQNEQQF